ncbi:Protein of unknown function (DUF4005) [Orobanche minor]
MGKNSWLTAVKRAFRSPSKDSEKKSCRRKVEHQQEDEEEKKTDRRRWLFKKQSNNSHQLSEAIKQTDCLPSKTPAFPAGQRHAIAVAEAAVATAKAAVEIIRLAQPSNVTSYNNLHSAARVIQTAFRGYLARRALIALKGIVKLQALVRGQNVRKQATMTMKCMQTLVRVQARMRDQRARLSHDGGRRSMFAEDTNNFWESNNNKYLKDIRERKSRSRDGSCITDDWRECPRTLEELGTILKARNQAALAHEKSHLAFAFSQQDKILDSDRYTITEDDQDYRGESETEDRANWLDKWGMSTEQPWENTTYCRASTDDYKRGGDSDIKTIEIDSLKTSSSSYPSTKTNGRKSRCQSPIHRQVIPQSLHRRSQSPCPPISKTKLPQIRPSSPRSIKEEQSYSSTANTPSLRVNSTISRSSNSSAPSYMAATESAKARNRSQSAPRQRPSTPERERSGYVSGSAGPIRKRLSYPIPEPYCLNSGFGCSALSQNQASPSFKSVQTGYVGMEEQSNFSCYTQSIGGEISPSSTTDLRRWLR